jgi:hypothetical protein
MLIPVIRAYQPTCDNREFQSDGCGLHPTRNARWGRRQPAAPLRQNVAAWHDTMG